MTARARAATTRLYGDAGGDTIDDFCGINSGDGGSGSDGLNIVGTAKGGAGDDEFVFAYNDRSNICGGCFKGLALGGAGDDEHVSAQGGTADGGSGNDLVQGWYTGDQVRGGSGNDQLVNNFDDLVGGATLTMDGRSGPDTCEPRGVPDILISCEKVICHWQVPRCGGPNGSTSGSPHSRGSPQRSNASRWRGN